MTVGDLIKQLEKLDSTKLVVLSKDAEGNTFSPLADIDDTMVYKAEASWYGYVGFDALTGKLKSLGFDEADIIEDGTPCVILWSIN